MKSPITRSDLLLLEIRVKQQLDAGELDEKLMYDYIHANRSVIESVYTFLFSLEKTMERVESEGKDKHFDGSENFTYRAYKSCAEQLRFAITVDEEGKKEYYDNYEKQKVAKMSETEKEEYRKFKEEKERERKALMDDDMEGDFL